MLARCSFFCVGVDAHIDPLGTIEFALDFRIIRLCRRGDVGIAPYARLGIRTKIENPDED